MPYIGNTSLNLTVWIFLQPMTIGLIIMFETIKFTLSFIFIYKYHTIIIL